MTSAGARLARPGEFTERAFLLGKIDLVEAEAVRDLIDARTPEALRASARRLDGALSRELAEIREELSRAAAELAATIDFAEDVGESVSPATVDRVGRAADALERLAAGAERGRLLAEGARLGVSRAAERGQVDALQRARGDRAGDRHRHYPEPRETRSTRRSTWRACRSRSSTRPACGRRATKSSASASPAPAMRESTRTRSSTSSTPRGAGARKTRARCGRPDARERS